MAGYSQFCSEKLSKLRAYNGEWGSMGAFELWFPFIYLNTSTSLAEYIRRLGSNSLSIHDQEVFYTFFHEYVHLLQSALFTVAQLPMSLTHFYIYDAAKTAELRKCAGEQVLHPILHSSGFVENKNILCEIYQHYTPVELVGGDICNLCAVHILEGVARILEEAFRHKRLSHDPLYNAIRDVNGALLGPNQLNDRDLLDVCEVALHTRFPDVTFVSLLQALRDVHSVTHSDFYSSLRNIVNNMKVAFVPFDREALVGDARCVYKGNLFEGYCSHLKSLYCGLPLLFQGRPAFSSVYDSVSHDDGRGLPKCLISWIHHCGSPIVQYSNGRLEQFDVEGTKDGIRMDQNIIGIKAVVDVLSGCDSNGCCYYAACYDACERPLTNAPKVDERCKTHPWDKENRDGKLCPFTAIWRAFGLEGLERGNPPESGMFKEESNDLRLELKFGEVFGCEVRVWSEDKGSTPHFHVRTMARDHKKTKKTIDCCVRIGEARYFKHGNHTGELNAQQRRKLNEFLKKDVEREDGQFSVWTCIMEEWNKHYPNQIVPKGTKQPDYTQIDDG